MKSWIVVPFALSSFVSAALLFVAEPMLGKMALAPLGGTPAVWNTCLLFFQATLLVGYLLALGMSRLGGPRRMLGLIALGGGLAMGYLVQPMVLDLGDPGLGGRDDAPAISLLISLIGSSALPLAVISSTAPLTQHWFSRMEHARSHDPYFLYAASNSGSLLALLAYPLWIEPRLSLNVQSLLWRQGYVVLAGLLCLCGGLAWYRPREDWKGEGSRHDGSSTSPRMLDLLRWIALAAIPSSWLLGVTTFLTTNLASMPLFWVIPLALFLLASIVAFSETARPVARSVSRVFPWLAIATVMVQIAGFVHAIWLPLHLVTFFLGCIVCNLRLTDSRPNASHVTLFYLAIAVGGVLGGVFNALLAPLLFRGIAEYPLAILCASLALTTTKRGEGNRQSTAQDLVRELIVPAFLVLAALPLAMSLFDINESLIGVVLLMLASGLGIFATLKAAECPLRFGLTIGAILLTGLFTSDPAGTTILRERDFYGVVRVTVDRESNCRRLLHGATLHGEQSLEPALRGEPRTYFTRSGPIGDIFRSREEMPPGDVAIVGLGVGTLAAYARAGERWAFYELDPAIVRIAGNPQLFTYLADCKADSVETMTGDARLRIRNAAEGRYSMIILDAFGSDAVPVHLISREAIQLYLSKLAEGGLLVFNITNGYLDLEPVIGLQARDAGLACLVRRDIHVEAEERARGKQGSIWAVMARTMSDLQRIQSVPGWNPPRIRAGARPWTDDYSDLVSYLLILSRRTVSETATGSTPR